MSDKVTSILEALRSSAVAKSRGIKDNSFQVRGQWLVSMECRPLDGERIFRDSVAVVQTLRQGACYGRRKCIPAIQGIVGKDVRRFRTGDVHWDIALLDAWFSVLRDESDEKRTVRGSPVEKARVRAWLLGEEVQRVIERTVNSRRVRVVNVGAVESIIEELTNRGLEVCATDLTRGIDKNILGARVYTGQNATLEMVKRCHVAVVTGMALANGTLYDIMKIAKRYGTAVVVFAETGSWFGREYCEQLGVDACVSEAFPFYIYEGHTQFRVYRSRRLA